MHKWDQRFLELARFISAWSKDPSTKVGSVIVDDNNRIISCGYNGFPTGIEDHEERYSNREQKLEFIVHAEANALMFAKQNIKSCTIYIWPFMSCSKCSGLIIQSGIQRVVAQKNSNEKWAANFAISKKMFEEAGVELVEMDIDNDQKK